MKIKKVKWVEFVNREMWGIEIDVYDEWELTWLSSSKNVGIYVSDPYETFFNIIPREVGYIVEAYSDGSALIYFDRKYYKVDYLGPVYWVVKLSEGVYIGERGYGTFERAKKEAMKIEKKKYIR
jgi:hypothetical protein